MDTAMWALSKAALLGTDLVRGAVAVPGDEPGGVVVGNELLQPTAQLFDGVEGMHPEEVLLQGADEAFGNAVALGLADGGGRPLETKEGVLALEVAGQVVRAVVVAEREALGRILLDAAEVAQDALPDLLERLEAVAGARGMIADALTGAVVDGDEDPGPALPDGHALGH